MLFKSPFCSKSGKPISDKMGIMVNERLSGVLKYATKGGAKGLHAYGEIVSAWSAKPGQ